MPVPPPPPGPPPPPAFPAFVGGGGGKGKSSGGSDPNSRNQLLDSIRQGAKLKKAPVVNDRSAPIVDANRNKSSGGSTSSLSNNSVGGISAGSGGGRGNGLTGPPGLGDLFAGGIPKLKPVGSTPVRGGGNHFNSNAFGKKSEKSKSGGSPNSNSYNNNNINNNNNHSISITMKSNSASLGNKPPPPPPPASNLKPSQSSNTNVSSSQSVEVTTERKSTPNFGKPSLAPKPPGMNGSKPVKPNPPPKLPNLYIPLAPPMNSSIGSTDSNTSTPPPPTPPSASVNRAQSMRMPKSASPTTPSAGNIEYRTMGRAAGRDFAAMNTSGQPPPPPRVINGIGTPGRMRASPLRPPSARPPPPPNKLPPNHPPPPPPSSAPPAPPHRTGPAPTPPLVRVNGNLGPLPPAPLGGPPPPPPTRNSSMRSINSTSSVTSVASSSGSSSSSVVYTGPDLEARFGHLFHATDEIPYPTPFRGIMKTYPSKNAQSIKRQPAPQPPTQIQLGPQKLWANNTSSC